MCLRARSCYGTVLLILALLATGCAGITPGITLFSVEQEIDMGRQFSREIARQQRIIRDPMVVEYIQELGFRLTPAEAQRIYPFRFYVVDNREVNAFAVPGGHVYIHSGLITRAENEAELASVLAHEIGHVVLRHSNQQVSAQYGYQLIASLLLGRNPAGWQTLAANLFGTAGLLSYSRAHESEADLFAIQNLYRTGYDVRAMVAFFQKLRQMQNREPDVISRFFSSHPTTSERIARISGIISSRPAQASPLRSTGAFLLVKERLGESGP